MVVRQHRKKKLDYKCVWNHPIQWFFNEARNFSRLFYEGGGGEGLDKNFLPSGYKTIPYNYNFKCREIYAKIKLWGKCNLKRRWMLRTGTQTNHLKIFFCVKKL